MDKLRRRSKADGGKLAEKRSGAGHNTTEKRAALLTGGAFLGVCFVASNSYNVRNVNSSGAMNWNNAYNGNRGARPLWWNTANE